MTDRLRAWVRAPSLWLFLLLLSLYCLTLGGEFYISDGEVVFQTIVGLARGQGLALPCNPGLPQIVPGIGGQCYSKYGLGMPLFALGPYLVGEYAARLLTPLRLFAGEPIALGHFVVASLNLVLTAATGVVLYWFARDVYRSRWLGLVLALVYGVATSAWPYSKVFFSEPLIAFLMLLAAYALYRYRGQHGLWWVALAGLALGFGILTKVATIIVLPLLGLYCAWRLLGRPWRREAGLAEPAPELTGPRSLDNFVRITPRLAARQARRRPRRWADPEAIYRFPIPLRAPSRPATEAVVASPPQAALSPKSSPAPLARRAVLQHVLLPLAVLALPVLLGAALELWHNALRFGSPLATGYADEGFTTPLYVGLYGLLFSSGKSIFLFSPPVILGLPGLVALWRRRPAEAALFASIVLVTLLYYSAWWAWYGGWSWGPRFLVPVLPFLVLPIGEVLLQHRWSRWMLVPLVVLGVGVQILGALVDFNPFIAQVVADNPANEAQYIFYPWLSPIGAHLEYLLHGQHLAVATFDMTRLGFTRRFALVFPVVVIAGFVGSAIALLVAFRPRARGSSGGSE